MGTLAEETAALSWLREQKLGEPGATASQSGLYTSLSAQRTDHATTLVAKWKTSGLPFGYDRMSTFTYVGGLLRRYEHERDGEMRVNLVYVPTSGCFRYDNADAARHEEHSPEDMAVLLGDNVLYLGDHGEYPRGAPIATDFSGYTSAFFALDMYAADFAGCLWPGPGCVPNNWTCDGDHRAVTLRRFAKPARRIPECKVRLVRSARTQCAQIVSLRYGKTGIRWLIPETIELAIDQPDAPRAFVVLLKSDTGRVLRTTRVYPFPPPHTGSNNALLRIKDD